MAGGAHTAEVCSLRRERAGACTPRPRPAPADLARAMPAWRTLSLMSSIARSVMPHSAAKCGRSSSQRRPCRRGGRGAGQGAHVRAGASQAQGWAHDAPVTTSATLTHAQPHLQQVRHSQAGGLAHAPLRRPHVCQQRLHDGCTAARRRALLSGAPTVSGPSSLPPPLRARSRDAAASSPPTPHRTIEVLCH